jgi:hypothetical protein
MADKGATKRSTRVDHHNANQMFSSLISGTMYIFKLRLPIKSVFFHPRPSHSSPDDLLPHYPVPICRHPVPGPPIKFPYPTKASENAELVFDKNQQKKAKVGDVWVKSQDIKGCIWKELGPSVVKINCSELLHIN